MRNLIPAKMRAEVKAWLRRGLKGAWLKFGQADLCFMYWIWLSTAERGVGAPVQLSERGKGLADFCAWEIIQHLGCYARAHDFSTEGGHECRGGPAGAARASRPSAHYVLPHPVQQSNFLLNWIQEDLKIFIVACPSIKMEESDHLLLIVCIFKNWKYILSLATCPCVIITSKAYSGF